jgi:hypothetical protein
MIMNVSEVRRPNFGAGNMNGMGDGDSLMPSPRSQETPEGFLTMAASTTSSKYGIRTPLDRALFGKTVVRTVGTQDRVPQDNLRATVDPNDRGFKQSDVGLYASALLRGILFGMMVTQKKNRGKEKEEENGEGNGGTKLEGALKATPECMLSPVPLMRVDGQGTWGADANVWQAEKGLPPLNPGMPHSYKVSCGGLTNQNWTLYAQRLIKPSAQDIAAFQSHMGFNESQMAKVLDSLGTAREHFIGELFAGLINRLQTGNETRYSEDKVPCLVCFAFTDHKRFAIKLDHLSQWRYDQGRFTVSLNWLASLLRADDKLTKVHRVIVGYAGDLINLPDQGEFAKQKKVGFMDSVDEAYVAARDYLLA